MYSAPLLSSSLSARNMPSRNLGSVDPAFSHITWTKRSGRRSVTALATAGHAQNNLESRPASPWRPW
eukprot:8169291-Lingulodinium_polyedra.AAC.1